jgi:hypothetical protein
MRFDLLYIACLIALVLGGPGLLALTRSTIVADFHR